MPRSRHLALLMVFAILAVARPAHADDPSERAAKRHYDRGLKLFNLQRFDDALDQYQKAFDAKPIPDFLFNIGQCQRNLGDYEAAIFSFKRFLKLDPEAPNRVKVEGLIADLETKIAEGDTRRLGLGRRATPDDSEQPDGGSPIYKKWWFWTGVAVVAGGVGIYGATRSDGPPSTDLGLFDFDGK